MKKKVFLLLFVLYLVLTAQHVLANPASTNFEMRDFSFGSGGTEDSDSTNYGLWGILGLPDQGKLGSTNFQIGAGQVYTIMPAVPPAPTFTNPGNNYDRLKFVLNTAGNPDDVTYAIAISTDDFVTTNYVQSDGTIGTVLGFEDFKTYTNWGGAGGTYITGLDQDTAYKIKAKSRQGVYTETGWGPTATASTTVPTLTFGVDAHSITFDNLNAGNSYTDSSKSTTLTTTTNAYNGYIVYAYATDELKSGTNQIDHYSSPNSAPTTWAGTGFGYTTDDSDLIGGTGNRFTSGGPKYAGFIESSPGDPVADTAGPVLTELSNDEYTVSYRVTADGSQAAGTYQTTIIYIVVPTY